MQARLGRRKPVLYRSSPPRKVGMRSSMVTDYGSYGTTMMSRVYLPPPPPVSLLDDMRCASSFLPRITFSAPPMSIQSLVVIATIYLVMHACASRFVFCPHAVKRDYLLGADCSYKETRHLDPGWTSRVRTYSSLLGP